jgi:hypothetical protein
MMISASVGRNGLVPDVCESGRVQELLAVGLVEMTEPSRARSDGGSLVCPGCQAVLYQH